MNPRTAWVSLVTFRTLDELAKYAEAAYALEDKVEELFGLEPPTTEKDRFVDRETWRPHK